VHNLWIPDGFKDTPADTAGHRSLLKDSLDRIYRVKLSRREIVDALESKLFGIGVESCTVGSHEFYMGYVMTRQDPGPILCVDFGHFHPTESIADKISALLLFTDGLLLHVSRGVRWDSDHVVILGDELVRTMSEIVRMDALGRVRLAIDYFDASIDRVGAWVTGSRATLQAVLLALLEPRQELAEREDRGDGHGRLAVQELAKTLPWGAVWDRFCLTQGVPTGRAVLREVERYGRDVLSKRG
jgi:L-rhamnose isomerase